MRLALVCLLAATAVAGAAAAGDFNFFPSTAFAKSADPAALTLKPFPEPWSLAAQTAYPELGNEKATGLLKIAISDYFPASPTLYVMPGAWCDAPGPVAGPQPNGLRLRGAAGAASLESGQLLGGGGDGEQLPVGATDFVEPEDAPPAVPENESTLSEFGAPDEATATPAATAEPKPVEEAAPAAVAAAPAAANAKPAAANAKPAEVKAAAANAKPAEEAKPAEPAAANAKPAPAAANAKPADAPAAAAAANAKPAEAPAAAAAANAKPADAKPAARRLAARRLMQQQAAEEEPAVPLFSVLEDGTCALSADSPVTYRVGRGAPVQVAERVEVDGQPVFKVVLPSDLPDGQHCVEVTAAYDAARVRTSPPYAELGFEELGATMPVSRTVCVFKLTKQAEASLDFDMCTNNEMTLNVADVRPLPVNVSLDAEPTGKTLLRPLVKVWGGKVAELDGTPVPNRNYDEVASRTEFNWVARYLPVPASYAGEPLSLKLSDTLQEGYYEISSVVSVMTEYPQLASLIGLNQIVQDDASGKDVVGKFEAAARQVHTKARVGVQKGSTKTTLSAISSPSHPRGKRVRAGQQVVLEWQFRGVGAATCTHDGAAVSNADDGKCVSPLTVEAARDVAAGDSRHTVTVTFNDVCGRVRTAEFEYTQQGVKPLTPPENPDGSVRLLTDAAKNATGGAGLATAVRSGAAGVAASALAGAAALAAAVAML